MLEKIFKLKENKTTVRTEIVAGLTTFMTMAYIIALNPNLLTNWGKEQEPALWNGIFMATCIASAIGMFVMAFAANKPFAMAPGMGLNSFFAVVATNVMTIASLTYVEAYQAVVSIVLIEGLVFIVLSVLNIREKIVEAIAPAIGMMLLNIGLGSNATILNSNYDSFFMLKDFFGALTAKQAKESMGSAWPEMVLSVITAFVGLFIIVVLAKKGFKAAVIVGMMIASAIFWAGEAIFLGKNPFAGITASGFIPPFGDMAHTTLFKYNFDGFMKIGWATTITLIVTFCIIDMFDTIGTLVGTASRAGMLDKNGKMPNMKEALLSDAIGTVAGSATGTSTVTTFIESASGVEAGGRTGLVALTTGFLFLACIFISPIAAIIPPAATSSALIYVGILMLSGLKNIDFNDIFQSVPVGLMLIAMPISSSIGHAIGIGLISYTVLKLLSGKAKEVSALTYVLSVIFLVKFFLVV